ncbi:MAG: hypothetical protein ACRDLF_00750 [Solirubrobacteraceae bacterium]
MSYLPDLPSKGGGSLSSRRPPRALAKSHRRVFNHGLGAWADAEEARQDAEAVADAAEVSLERELQLLQRGLALAGSGCPAGIELVARKAELLSMIDDRLILRRWG